MEAPDDFPFDISVNENSITFSINQTHINYRNYHQKEVLDDINNITEPYKCYSEKNEVNMSFLICTLDKKKVICLCGNGWTEDEQKNDFLYSYKELSKNDKNLIINFIVGM